MPTLQIGFRVEAEGHLSVTVCELVYETQIRSVQVGVVYTGSQSYLIHRPSYKYVTAQLHHAPNITEKLIVRNAPDAIINMTAECRQKCQFESSLAIHSLGVNNYGSEYYVKSSH